MPLEIILSNCKWNTVIPGSSQQLQHSNKITHHAISLNCMAKIHCLLSSVEEYDQ